MKNIVKLLFILFSLTLTVQSIAQRNIVMFHGLGGDDGSWRHYSKFFLDEKQKGINGQLSTLGNAFSIPTHETSVSVNFAATDARVKANTTSGSFDPNNIGIGSSMGGFTMREVDRQTQQQGQPPMFGGFITVGTSNQDVRLPIAYSQGEIGNFFTDLCQQVVTQPIGSLASLTSFGGSWASMLISAVSIRGVGNGLCEFGWVVTNNTELAKSFATPTANELVAGSSFQQLLQTNEGSPTKRVTMYGVEESPVHWRLLSNALLNKVPDLSFEEEGDQELVNIMNIAHDIEFYASIALGATAIGLTVAGFWNPWLWYYAAGYAYASYELYGGAKWLEQSEGIWNVITGAARTESYIVTTTMGCGDVTDPVERMSCMQECLFTGNPNCDITQEVSYTFTSFVNEASDGLVVASKTGLNGAAAVELQRVNHFETRNHQSTTNGFRRILFDGSNKNSDNGIRIPDFFTTP